ncbi:hypothetical protein P154DRAFT_526241 [Amniculicola lignicola CBS 123094]|uniref:Secreted protein n=1 Tax=Amniculicola lignicola CBS 123094 TaxID=1392246 RepID=A0A6A5W8U1_9PLEO|nr:hypothetical protein P154DRAFT_526241 [Amniculicola lignicola CBS 123094]
MPSRTTIFATLVIISLGSLYLLHAHSPTTFTMSSPPGLELALAQTSTSPPTLKVTLKNTSPSAYTILKWNTPFDPIALNLDIFTVTNVETNEKADIPRIMLKRKVPPSKDQLLEIPSGAERSVDVLFQKEGVVELSPAKYRVVAAGRYGVVWQKKKGEVSEEDLEDLGGDDRFRDTQFESAEVEMVVE